jgi:hypothetical protein
VPRARLPWRRRRGQAGGRQHQREHEKEDGRCNQAEQQPVERPRRARRPWVRCVKTASTAPKTGNGGERAGQMRSEERRERGDDQDDARGREHAHRDVPARRLNRLRFRCRRSASGHDVPDDEDEQHDRERLRCGPVDERQRDRGGGERSRPRGRTPPAPRSSAVPPAGRRRDVRTGAPRGLLRRSGAA